MCGILACIGENSDELDIASFNAALKLMNHRGPDGTGTVEDKGFKLGHTRLSIQDLSDVALQPMFSNCQQVIIIFNGEIYNFKELRLELKTKGFNFNTQSDTEVILNAYINKGINCVNDFNGMFSIIIIDKRSNFNKVFIIRDRLGIKPLYYFQQNNGYIFSSEIKSILSIVNKPFKLNKRSVSSYLSFRHSVLGETFFEGIDSILPGHYAEIVDNKLKQVPYWKLSNFVKSGRDDKGEEYYLDRLDELLTASVAYRMISDVPFGSYLSGGVDSSLITAIMSNISNDPIKTYTIGFAESGYNEFEYANIVANNYGTKHKQIEIDSTKYFETLKELISYKDAPLAVPNEIPLYLMSQELKQDITVVLSGEGADEIFGGYGRIFRSADDYEKQGKYLNVHDQFTKSYNRKYSNNEFLSCVNHFYYNYSYIEPELKQSLLSKGTDWSLIESSLKNKFQQSFYEIPKADYMTKMMYTFETIHLQGLLSRLDTTTMATSVEGRVPFVDHRLVEFAFTIPNKYKLKWKTSRSKMKADKMISDEISEAFDTPKYILKKYGEKYLPGDVIYRRKMGFPVPIEKWFGADLEFVAQKLLSDSNNVANQVIDVNSVLALLRNDRLSNNHGLAMNIWMVLNLFIFCNQYKRYLN